MTPAEKEIIIERFSNVLGVDVPTTRAKLKELAELYPAAWRTASLSDEEFAFAARNYIELSKENHFICQEALTWFFLNSPRELVSRFILHLEERATMGAAQGH